jgi:hypothetical protein
MRQARGFFFTRSPTLTTPYTSVNFPIDASLIARCALHRRSRSWSTKRLFSLPILAHREVSWTEVSWKFRGQTELALWENRTTLRVKGEFALTAIDNDLLSGPSLLWG